MMRFYLGTHETSWLWNTKAGLEGITFFVSRRRLARRISPFPRALHDFCIDSGGFTELQKFGRWSITTEQYVAEVRRYRRELGPDRLIWAAPMDWMCEPWVMEGGVHDGVRFHGTGRTVEEHQRLTVDNLLELRSMAPEIPWIPVLQGWQIEDYRRCAEMYAEAGVDLAAEPVVGLGTVCRRQATEEIGQIVSEFYGRGLRLHGFGVKMRGISLYADMLESSDSLAWSYNARKRDPLPGHTHVSCGNCPEWAARWQRRAQERITAAAMN